MTNNEESKEHIIKEVRLIINKTSYNQSESVKATVINNLASEIHKSSVDNSWLVLKKVNNDWQIIMNGKQKKSALCLCQEYPDTNCPAFTPLLEKFEAVKPGEKLSWSWDQTILEKNQAGCYNWVKTGVGTYKIQFRYFANENQKEKNWQMVFSDEFTIK